MGRPGGGARLTVLVSGCGYQGIDGTVFGGVAEDAGRPPVPALVDLSEGEAGLAATVLVLFGAGFVAGSSWQRLSGGRVVEPG